MPWQIGKPIALPWGGWEKFDNEQKAKYPIRFFLFDKIPEELGHIAYRWRNRVWAFKHRFIPKHKYHIIRTSLKPGYWDPDTQILHAVMDTVKQFVDITKDSVNWESEDAHAHAWAELQAVYDWWVNKYPNREDELPKLPDVDFGKIIGEHSEEHSEDPDVKEWKRVSEIHNQMEAEWVKEEEEMLIRVMKVRRFLWYP